MLHSGHVAFFEEASQHGDLYVGIGSDDTVLQLKGRPTVNSERERLYMIQSLKFVMKAMVNSGSGVIDFENEIKNIQPDILFFGFNYIVNCSCKKISDPGNRTN